jgi:hypothetical protein
MADKQACDAYAAEMARRFEDLVTWARDNWPVPSSPLLDSDFEGARRDLNLILGERLSQAQSADQAASPAAGGPQYVSVNPAPWP